jgi:hypothetical protein
MCSGGGWGLRFANSCGAVLGVSCREAEVVHARWAMLGVISLLLSDVSGSPFPPKEVSWAQQNDNDNNSSRSWPGKAEQPSREPKAYGVQQAVVQTHS